MSVKPRAGGRRGASRDRERPRGLDNWRGVGSFGTIGLEITLSIVLGFFGGRWLDGKLGTEPYLSIVGFVFGVAAAIRSVLRATRAMQAEAAREEREQGNPLPRYDAKNDDRKDDIVLDADGETPPEDEDEGERDAGDKKGEGDR